MKMDKNTILGLVLIMAILIGFSIYNQPSEKERAEKHKKDSLELAQRKKTEKPKVVAADTNKKNVNGNTKDTTITDAKTFGNTNVDSSKAVVSQLQYGLFSKAAKGNNTTYTIENDLMKIKLASKGGRISSVELKKYKTYSKQPLVLFDGDSSVFNLNFYIGNKSISTKDMFFQPYWYGKASGNTMKVSGTDSLQFGMRIFADTTVNSAASKKYIEFLYTLKGDAYMVGMKINFNNVNDVIADNTSSLPIEWQLKPLPQEKDVKTERANSTIYYKYFEDDVDFISESSDKSEDLKTKVQWIGFKQQFFTSVFIADKSFTSAKIATLTDKNSKKYVKQMTASVEIPFEGTSVFSVPTHFYFGPTHYQTLRQYHMDLERQIPLGWSFFLMQWINRGIVIPVFNFLEQFVGNYGIIILILTILLKIVLFPIAFRTYKSSAKMRVLKPEIEEIGAKFPKKEDSMKKQQATMALYKKAGVNPMAGCLPMLLQLPILISFFRFFPASFELRQQAFLWADDLSAYDSVYSWTTQIPILSTYYGNHISLFTLLMTVSTIIYTKINNDMMGTTNQMPGMKVMMYLMPILFLGMFNSFSAGLSYYYFLANVITFAQMYIIRKFIDESAIHRQIQENKKKPDTHKKSGFQKRLEDMAKQRGYKLPNKK